jgi:hypothetical protein
VVEYVGGHGPGVVCRRWTVVSVYDDRGTHRAGALTYYAMMSLFPLLLLAVSLLGLLRVVLTPPRPQMRAPNSDPPRSRGRQARRGACPQPAAPACPPPARPRRPSRPWPPALASACPSPPHCPRPCAQDADPAARPATVRPRLSSPAGRVRNRLRPFGSCGRTWMDGDGDVLPHDIQTATPAASAKERQSVVGNATGTGRTRLARSGRVGVS